MSLRLRVEVTRTVGPPSSSSVGVSCHVEFELDLGPETPEAVHDGPTRLQASPTPPRPPTVRHWIESRTPASA